MRVASRKHVSHAEVTPDAANTLLSDLKMLLLSVDRSFSHDAAVLHRPTGAGPALSLELLSWRADTEASLTEAYGENGAVPAQ